MNKRYQYEQGITIFFTVVTLVATFLFGFEVYRHIIEALQRHNTILLIQQVLFVSIVSFLIYGNILYQLTRFGYYYRLRNHVRASTEDLDTLLYRHKPPVVTVLIPSYKEDPKIVYQTLLSVLFQEYPRKRVVLLLDDPQHPRKKEERQSLESTRELVRQLNSFFAEEAKVYSTEEQRFKRRMLSGVLNNATETANLYLLYQRVCFSIEHLVKMYTTIPEQDRLFFEKIVQPLLRKYTHKAARFQHATSDSLRPDEICLEYQRLAGLFKVDLTSFERRSYINLSHEPNKAANLNSYLSLMGKRYKKVTINDKQEYLSPSPVDGQLFFPKTDFVLTLDADSILLPEYMMRLVNFMQQKENRRVAVVQTPYSANPHVTKSIERLAGATTDIQYIIHQGFTQYNATFWVGANALIRKKALDDIAEHQTKDSYHNFTIINYIQDRTVIEDTESTIDLVHRGWRLHNYPERLAHSASPPDFGSLLIQRRRWANGGIIVVPKLFSYVLSKPFRKQKYVEAFIRFHYLTSIGLVSLGILLLLIFPFGNSISSVFLPLTALPYYILYTRDLKLSGYSITDVFGVYAFNLMLIPINLGGFLKSLQQAITKKKIPFGRTPKVPGRTAAPALYVLSEYALLLYCIFASVIDLSHGLVVHALYSGVNGGFFAYVITRYIGIPESIEDVLSSIS